MSGFVQTNDSSINTSDLLTLQEVNDIYASYSISGVVFLCLFIILGSTGNSHVIYIYAFKFPKSNHRLYLLCLAVFDWTTCTVTMPFTVIDLTYPLMADNFIALCKIRRFLNYFLGCAAGLIMTIISYDRYHKICRPLRVQVSYKIAKCLCAIAILISCLFTWPAGVLFGSRTFPTKGGVDGAVCFSVESYKHYILYFHVALVVLISIAGGAAITFYVKIGQQMFKLDKKSTRTLTSLTAMQTHKVQETLPETIIETAVGETKTSIVVRDNDESFSTVQDLAADVPKRSKWNELRNTIKTKTALFQGFAGEAAPVQRARGITQNTQTMNAKRITIMFLIISVIYVACFIPYLVMTGILYEKNDFVAKFSFTARSLFYSFLWCFFFYNMINPIIFALCDQRYRKHLRQMYSTCLHFQRN